MSTSRFWHTALGMALLSVALPALAAPITIDFAAALKGVNFDPVSVDGNKDATAAGNGLLDEAEMALVAAILANEALDYSASGGACHTTVCAAYDQALASAMNDVKPLLQRYPTVAAVVAGYVMVGTQGSHDAIAAMCAAFGSPLEGDYSLALKLGGVLGPEGDADGDGATNEAEYRATIAGGTPAYVKAALDPGITSTEVTEASVFWCPMRGNPCAIKDYTEAGPCDDCGMALITKDAYEQRAAERKKNAKTVGIVLYDGFEVLDVYGPIEMWGYVKEFNVVTVAEAAGPVRSTQGIETIAQYSFENCPPLHILMVPGGLGTMRQLENSVLLDFLRKRHEETEITTSVCSGSALLARAGLLDGHKATSNKLFFDRATAQSDKVDWIRRARWVDDGKVITSSGVSAGTDMALHLVSRLYGDARARQIASGAEYVWNDDAANDPFAQGTAPVHP
jgi:putative intracellular protease/amidase